jgi:hypothetical protein
LIQIKPADPRQSSFAFTARFSFRPFFFLSGFCTTGFLPSRVLGISFVAALQTAGFPRVEE